VPLMRRSAAGILRAWSAEGSPRRPNTLGECIWAIADRQGPLTLPETMRPADRDAVALLVSYAGRPSMVRGPEA
jgi:hypothetical protein